MKTLNLKTINEIFKIIDYKFRNVPEEEKKYFNCERKYCFALVTFTNSMFTTFSYVDDKDTLTRRKRYLENNEIEYIVFIYDDEIYSNVNFEIKEEYYYDCQLMLNPLSNMHIRNGNAEYTDKYF